MIRHVLRFGGRVIRRLYRGHGLLLASAIAFDTLLSIVPLLALSLVVLTFIVSPTDARRLLSGLVNSLLPGASAPVTRAYSTFLEHRDVVGWFGLAGLIVFGAGAFRTAREAMTIVFETRSAEVKRHRASFLLPLVYAALTALGLIAGTVALTVVDAVPADGFTLLGRRVAVAEASRVVLGLIGFIGLVALFTSFYRVLPASRVALRHVLLGALIAAIAWELVRRLLVWYFEHLSLVGAVYGSLASVIVLLIFLYVGAFVFLVGAQVVAEIGRSARAQVPWYEEPCS